MAVTYGFYNALNHDRVYDAIQMSSIFDGIIRDGVFSTIGEALVCKASGSGLVVNVGSGRAWFNHTWTLNDTDYPVEAEQAEVVLDRIDAIVLEVNQAVEVRANSIKFVKGTPSSNPVRPTLIHNAEVNQYALAYVSVRAGQTTIFQEDITNVIGTDETPFITGLMQQVSIESLLTQWAAEFNTYFANFKTSSNAEFTAWMTAKVTEYTNWYAQMQTDMAADFTEFDDWFQHMKDQLSEDAAGHLQAEIDAIVATGGKGSVVTVVTTDSRLFSRPVLLAQGSEEISGSFDATGVAKFDTVPMTGDVTITSNDGTLTATTILNIPYFGRYTVDLEFWTATLNISTSFPQLYSRTITITKGATTVGTVQFSAEGTATYDVHSAGVYTLTVTDASSNVYTAEVNVTAETTYPVVLGNIPNGKTVTPVNSVPTWLACAEIFDKSYSTLEQVLADQETLELLLQHANACDYMARSTDWADDIADDQDAMDLIGHYDYCSEALLSNATWAEAIAKSEYWEEIYNISVPRLTAYDSRVQVTSSYDSAHNGDKAFDRDSSTYWATSYNTLSGHIQWDFTDPVVIHEVALKFNPNVLADSVIIEAYDGANWIPISDPIDVSDHLSSYYIHLENTNAYRYYGATVSIGAGSYTGIAELQFYGRTPAVDPYVALVPTMTDNTHPSGECIGTVYSSGGAPVYDLYHAFDGNTGIKYMDYTVEPNVYGYIGYHFPEPKVVKRFDYAGNLDSPYMLPTKIRLQASNNGIDWVYLTDEIDHATADTVKHTVIVSNDTAYEYYRLECTKRAYGDGYYSQFSEIQFYSKEYGTIHSAPNDTLYIMQNGSPVTLCTTDSNGIGEVDWSEFPTGNIAIYSSVAKNPDNLSADYYKSIRVSNTPFGGTTEVYLVPNTIKTLYWYGWISDILEETTAANGWTQNSTYPFNAPTYNTNYVYTGYLPSSHTNSYLGTKRKVRVNSNVNIIAMAGKVSYETAGAMLFTDDKSLTSPTQFLDNPVQVNQLNVTTKYQGTVSSSEDGYIRFGTTSNMGTEGHHRWMNTYAVWFN